jgi:hypothetical protein
MPDGELVRAVVAMGHLAGHVVIHANCIAHFARLAEHSCCRFIVKRHEPAVRIAGILTGDMIGECFFRFLTQFIVLLTGRLVLRINDRKSQLRKKTCPNRSCYVYMAHRSTNPNQRGLTPLPLLIPVLRSDAIHTPGLSWAATSMIAAIFQFIVATSGQAGLPGQPFTQTLTRSGKFTQVSPRVTCTQLAESFARR